MQVGLLGPLEVRDGAGAPVEVGGARARTLLALLALAPGQVVTTAMLIDRIWGDDPPDAAANALQALVSRLRRRLPDGSLESHPAGYRLAVAPEAVDVCRFERLVAAGGAALDDDPGRAAAALDEALALWRGPPLAGLNGARLAMPETTRLEELRLRAMEDRAEAHLRLGNGRHLVPELEALVTSRPTRERATGLLMRVLYADGRGGDALAAYQRTRAALADRFGADPSPELADLHRRVLRGDPGLLPPPPSAIESRTNLRAELTSFVGREEDVARISKLVGESRLTTLTGPGGSGKTRLAVEAARPLVEQMPDGVWLVELAPLTEAATIPHTVLAALGLRDHLPLPSGRGRAPADDAGPGPVDRLARALAGKAALLVLDNCEHLVADVAAVAQRLLSECRRLRILATSREPLGITGEVLWPVAPLPLPPAGVAAAEARAYPAVQLLADRAAAVQPLLALDESTMADAVRICRALDGMPLAIELAAARLRTMTPGQLADRLGARFRLLTGGSRTARARHQTLRAVVDWSWDLLEQPERTLLRRLAYFSGGVSLEAAERVCAGDGMPADQVLDLVTALADKSLLVPVWHRPPAGEAERSPRSSGRNPEEQHSGDQPRYRMLQTIKAYGLDRLAEAGETHRIRRAHAAYFVELAETAEPMLRTGEQRRWLDRLDADHENLQAALRGAITAGEAETAVRLVAALGWYWSLAGRRREALPLAVQALALPGEVPDEVRALAYTGMGCGAMDVVPEAEVRRWFETAAQLAAQTDLRHPMLRMVGPLSALFEAWVFGQAYPPAPVLEPLLDDPDPWVRATALNMRVYLTLNTVGYRPELIEDVRAALAGYRLAGDRWGVAFALQSAAELAILAGDLTTALAHLQEAVAMLSELGIPEDRVMFQIRLAELRWVRGDGRAAYQELAAAGRTAERIGMPGPRVMVARARGELYRLAGDLPAARGELDRAWQLADGLVAAPELRATVLCALGHLATAEGDPVAARGHLDAGLELALAGNCAPVLARVLVGLADLELAGDRPDWAGLLLGVAVAARGAEDPSVPDAARIAAAAEAALGEPEFAEAYARGRHSSPTVETVRELVAATPFA